MTNKLGPYDLNTIVTGDARELAEAIPDESVDLIFTDPVYDRIDDYRWLAETAARVLRPDRACLVWGRNQDIYKIQNAMIPPLEYVKIIALNIMRFISGLPQTRYDNHSIEMWTPCLWLQKGNCIIDKRFRDYLWATWGNGTSQYHKWQKPLKPMIDILSRFTNPDAIVFDPFTGGGTVPAVCKMLSRNYLAFEIDEATADAARERVLLTQPPLFVMEPEQLELMNV